MKNFNKDEFKEVFNRDFWKIFKKLFIFLSYWNRINESYDKKTVGIPQDIVGDMSRILANFYLSEYDENISRYFKKNEILYFRYADDQFIFGNDEKKLEEMVFYASKELNKINLNINSKKVKLWKTNELYENNSFKLFDIFNLEKNNNISEGDAVNEFIENI